ncbi:hypothetical protein KGY64_05620 [Candidatus Bipolaricaulota bacterium]|nr:hypothetical protein [Candidatus Bipolaricaulota bacterium]
MRDTKKLTVSISQDPFDSFEDLRKKYGADNRSKEVQKALELRVKQWKRKQLEQECKEASRGVEFEASDSYETQGKALNSRLSE